MLNVVHFYPQKSYEMSFISNWASGPTGIMLAVANTSRRAGAEVVQAWHHPQHRLRALLDGGAPLAGAVLITLVIKRQAGIYLSR